MTEKKRADRNDNEGTTPIASTTSQPCNNNTNSSTSSVRDASSQQVPETQLTRNQHITGVATAAAAAATEMGSPTSNTKNQKAKNLSNPDTKKSAAVSGYDDDGANEIKQEEQASEEITPRLIQEWREKEIERERRSLPMVAKKKPYIVTNSPRTSSVITPPHVLDQQLKDMARRERNSAMIPKEARKVDSRAAVGSYRADNIRQSDRIGRKILRNSGKKDCGAGKKSATVGHREDRTETSHSPTSSTSSTTSGAIARTNSYMDEKTGQSIISRPGAFAQDGPGRPSSSSRRDSAVEEVLAALARDQGDATLQNGSVAANEGMGGSPTNSIESTMEPGESYVSRRSQAARRGSIQSVKGLLSFRGSLVKAQMVDDAEAIIYAEDAVVDNFRRRLVVGVIVLVVLCVMAITLVLLLRNSPTDGKDDCGFDDKECCVDFDKVTYPGIIGLTCHCLGTAESLYKDFDPVNIQVYNETKNRLVTAGIIDEEMASLLQPDSCGIYNQVLLTIGKLVEEDISPKLILEMPLSVLGNLFALFAIYGTMDGRNWNQDTGWVDDVVVCNWFGIDCLFIEMISGLFLPQNGLKGPIPTEISLLSALRELDLSGNDGITGFIPTQIAALTSLSLLDLSGLSMEGSIPTGFKELQGINKLNLASSQLTGTIPVELFEFPSIRFLSLSHNKLRGTLPTNLGDCSTLDVLKLNGNGLTGPLPSEVVNMTSLGLLHIGENNFSGTIPDFLGQMTKLEFIDVYKSGLTGSIPETFCDGLLEEENDMAHRVAQRTRRIVVDCNSTEFCSCCDPSGDRGVRVLCGNIIPDVAIGKKDP